MAKENKTNAVRMLDKLNIRYAARTYECGEFTDGGQISDILGESRGIVFKTLVTVGRSGKYYVLSLPVDKEADLKKCARIVGEKSLEPVHVKELLSVTGYVRGGCSPIGMKKPYRVLVHESARDLEKMIVSGGRLGLQLELAPADLLAACSGEFADVAAK